MTTSTSAARNENETCKAKLKKQFKHARKDEHTRTRQLIHTVQQQTSKSVSSSFLASHILSNVQAPLSTPQYNISILATYNQILLQQLKQPGHATKSGSEIQRRLE